jgi:FMN phosphatase YigB (HAD superfamily)
MNIQAIYWDIGGVLVRTEDRTPRAELAKRLGMTAHDLEELVFGGEHGRQAQSGQITADQQWEYVCQVLNWPAAEWKTLEQEFFRGDHLDTKLLDYIGSLRPRHKTGVISNALSNVRPMAEGGWGMAEAFDTLVFSAEVGIMKPDPRIFPSLCKPWVFRLPQRSL